MIRILQEFHLHLVHPVTLPQLEIGGVTEVNQISGQTVSQQVFDILPEVGIKRNIQYKVFTLPFDESIFEDVFERMCYFFQPAVFNILLQ